MFQAAYGLAAARRLNVELKFDLSWYDEYSHHRQYILDRFKVNAAKATEKEIYDIVTCNASNFVSYRWNRFNRLTLKPYYQRPKVVESLEKFDINYTKIIDNTYVEGYFPSRDFFADQLGFVKDQLSFKTQPSETSRRFIEKIRTENAVAISFRLGDFLQTPFHNVASIEYYQRCINYLAERYTDLRFYFFSDDLDWVKANFKTNHPMEFMDFNQPDYMEDLRLLTHFKFHIIPSSTFSWWGAFLAPDGGKVVLCPEHWLHPDKDMYKNHFGGKMVDYSHVLPAEWIKIPNIVAGDHYISK